MVTPGKIYRDQTGRFSVTSRKITKYMFVLYCYDVNKIITKLLKNRTGKYIVRA